MFKHLLVPTDGSPLSQQAMGQAIAFAGETGARITFFCAARPFPPIYFGSGAIMDAQAPQQFQRSATDVAQDILTAAETQARAAGVVCASLMLVSDAPYEAIIEAARQKGCDLIFMASHGRRGVDALLLGSETQKVLTHSNIPVLVYR